MTDGGPDEHAELRERFAVALVTAWSHRETAPNIVDVFDEAQRLTVEAMGRRIRDAAVAQNAELQAGAEAMKDDPPYADAGDEGPQHADRFSGEPVEGDLGGG